MGMLVKYGIDEVQSFVGSLTKACCTGGSERAKARLERLTRMHGIHRFGSHHERYLI